jgi:hypothetical protein
MAMNADEVIVFTTKRCDPLLTAWEPSSMAQQTPCQRAREAIRSCLRLNINLHRLARKADLVRNAKYNMARHMNPCTLSRIVKNPEYSVSAATADAIETAASLLRIETLITGVHFPLQVFEYCPKKHGIDLDESTRTEAASAIIQALLSGGFSVHLPKSLLGAVAWLGDEDSGIMVAVVNSDLKLEDRRRVMAHELEDARQRLIAKLPRRSNGDGAAYG